MHDDARGNRIDDVKDVNGRIGLHALRHVDQGSVGHEGGVQRRKALFVERRDLREMALEEVGRLAPGATQAHHPNTQRPYRRPSRAPAHTAR